MKREHVLALVRTRMDQAHETLDDARKLLGMGGSPRSIINRAYYAAFYGALALMQTIGQAPSKHAGVISLFDREFYGRGLFSKEQSRSFHELFELRQFSDYRAVEPATTQQAQDALEKAQAFVSAVEASMIKAGYLSKT